MNSTAAPVLTNLTTLSDPLRVRMLLVLEGQELAVSDLCDILQLPQSTVSRHLKTLADDGWVSSRREATSRLYSLVVEELTDAAKELWALVRAQMRDTPAARQDAGRLTHVVDSRRAKSQAFFSSAAGQWDRLRDDLFGTTFQFQGLLGLIDGEWTIADLGCGTGRTSEALAPFFRKVIAVDASESMLAAARARLASHANVDLRQGTLEALPMEAASVDAACLMLVLHHVADPAKVLQEVARVLKPGGRLLLTDMLPHERDEYRQQMGHVWLGFSERQLARHLAAAGFSGLHVVPLPPDARAKGPTLFTATARRATVEATREIRLLSDRVGRDAHA